MEKTTKAPKRPQKRKDNEFALHATVIMVCVIILVIFGMIWRCTRKHEKTEPNIEYITDSISTIVPDTLPTPTSPAIRTEEVSNAASQSSGNNSYGEYEYASSSKSYNCGYDNGFEDGECDALDGNFNAATTTMPSPHPATTASSTDWATKRVTTMDSAKANATATTKRTTKWRTTGKRILQHLQNDAYGDEVFKTSHKKMRVHRQSSVGKMWKYVQSSVGKM